MMYNGSTKLVLKHLGFLLDEYKMNFSFQTFADYNGFYGPIDTYSFYNEYGCFTLHHVVQRGEWKWFTSEKISKNQYELLKKEINPNLYISSECFLYRTVLKRLGYSVKRQIETTGGMFNIKVDKV